MVFFTADTHFGHANVIKHCNRPYATLDEMNEALIANWNARVHKNDHVYIAGDLAWRGNVNYAISIVSRLKGLKHLAIGNHDKDFLKKAEYRNLFVEIDQILFAGLDQGKTIICHYPMLSWNGSCRGAWHVFGHMHNNLTRESIAYNALRNMDKALNAGVDICQFMPVTFQELITYNNVWKEKEVLNERDS